MDPAIIEVAINGLTSKSRNPHVPVTPGEIAAEANRLLDAGAAIIHNHTEDIRKTGEEAAERYGEGWQPILARHPDAILCPTSVVASSIEDKLAHIRPCREHGAAMAALDPGSVNLSNTASDGSPGDLRFCHINTIDEIDRAITEMAAADLAPSIAIYEPGFLRTTLAYHRAGKLPAGTMVKLYFAGDRDFMGETSSRGKAIGFGLPPTATALSAYIEMLDGSGLPWSVAVLGGDVVETGMARLALERGGHVRIGLEDYAGDRQPTNLQLLDELLGEFRAVGRPVASCRQAAEIMGLTR